MSPITKIADAIKSELRVPERFAMLTTVTQDHLIVISFMLVGDGFIWLSFYITQEQVVVGKRYQFSPRPITNWNSEYRYESPTMMEDLQSEIDYHLKRPDQHECTG